MAFTPAFLAVAALSFWVPGHETDVCPHGVAVRVVPAFTAQDVTLDTAAGQTLKTVAASAPLGVGRCAFAINDRVWRTLRPAMRCTVVVHELGHSVIGLQHSTRPVMRAVLTGPIRWCARLVRHYEREAAIRRAWCRLRLLTGAGRPS